MLDLQQIQTYIFVTYIWCPPPPPPPHTHTHTHTKKTYIFKIITYNTLCVPFTNYLIACSFMIVVSIIIGNFSCPLLFILTNILCCMLYLGSFGSETPHLLGCFCHRNFSLISELNTLPSDSFMSCTDSLLGAILQRSSRLCNRLSLWCLVPVINRLSPACWSII